MKCRESSETRFRKVSWRSELILWDRQPFEVSNFVLVLDLYKAGTFNKRYIAISPLKGVIYFVRYAVRRCTPLYAVVRCCTLLYAVVRRCTNSGWGFAWLICHRRCLKAIRSIVTKLVEEIQITLNRDSTCVRVYVCVYVRTYVGRYVIRCPYSWLTSFPVKIR